MSPTPADGSGPPPGEFPLPGAHPVQPAAPVDPVPPPPPQAPDPLARRLEAIERELKLLGRTTTAAPLWLILAIALLLFCQALQFGLLIALLARTIRPAAPPAEAPTPVASTPAEPVTLASVASSGSAGEEAAPGGDLPAATPTEAPAQARPRPAASRSATVKVLGGEAYLMGPSGRVAPGAVPPGRYKVYAEAEKGAGFESMGRFTLEAGDTLTVRCGFGSCQATR